MAIITKDLAERIARKLNAAISSRKGRPHDVALVYHENRLVATFGIRRGSKKEQSHDHVPSSLHVSPNQARLLGQCPMSREEYIEVLRQKGLI